MADIGSERFDLPVARDLGHLPEIGSVGGSRGQEPCSEAVTTEPVGIQPGLFCSFFDDGGDRPVCQAVWGNRTALDETAKQWP